MSALLLRSAFFDDFKGGPKLVIWGNAKGIRALAKQLVTCAKSSGTTHMDAITTPVDGKKIVIEPAVLSGGMQRKGGGFAWRLDSEWMIAFAEMIEVLAVSEMPAHQYLECGFEGEIVVMVSRDEYPDELNPEVPAVSDSPI